MLADVRFQAGSGRHSRTSPCLRSVISRRCFGGEYDRQFILFAGRRHPLQSDVFCRHLRLNIEPAGRVLRNPLRRKSLDATRPVTRSPNWAGALRSCADDRCGLRRAKTCDWLLREGPVEVRASHLPASPPPAAASSAAHSVDRSCPTPRGLGPCRRLPRLDQCRPSSGQSGPCR